MDLRLIVGAQSFMEKLQVGVKKRLAPAQEPMPVQPVSTNDNHAPSLAEVKTV
ncbi:MAG TPA: hypothetical protein VGN95_14570 [Pyrinomonadaceae bacterium]|jgi:hypothetical protein|nr:hypothetical protein [Pyrinomonadaceae bacterium]